MTCKPIFIVGMPRSGTKLLRGLLNHHSEVSIPVAETGFIPYFAKNLRRYGDLSDRNNFNKLYHEVSRSKFFSYIPEAEQIWDVNQWYNSITDFSLSGVLSAFYELHALYEGKSIWGDKTPTYMLHIPLIKRLFPDAKIIHIYRDVRDYCLSIRKAWGKNIYRAAERWKRDIKQCIKDGEKAGENNYLELKYESLIDNTEQEMRKVCYFSNIEFEPRMVRPKRPGENLGDAKGMSEVLSQNYDKWKTQLTSKEIKEIEELSGSLMRSLGYVAKFVYGREKLGSLKMLYYRLFDGLHLFYFNWKKSKRLRDTLKWIVINKRHFS